MTKRVDEEIVMTFRREKGDIFLQFLRGCMRVVFGIKYRHPSIVLF
jgi:hypothetical protein